MFYIYVEHVCETYMFHDTTSRRFAQGMRRLMKDTEKLEIIISHLNDAYFIPTYCEDYVWRAIMRALREIRAAEEEKGQVKCTTSSQFQESVDSSIKTA